MHILKQALKINSFAYVTVAIMILLFLPNTMIDPWVLALFAGVLEAKIVWDVVS